MLQSPRGTNCASSTQLSKGPQSKGLNAETEPPQLAAGGWRWSRALGCRHASRTAPPFGLAVLRRTRPQPPTEHFRPRTLVRRLDPGRRASGCHPAPPPAHCRDSPVSQGHLLQAQYRLGHRDASTTLRVYSHVLPLTDQDAAATLDRLYQPSTPPDRPGHRRRRRTPQGKVPLTPDSRPRNPGRQRSPPQPV